MRRARVFRYCNREKRHFCRRIGFDTDEGIADEKAVTVYTGYNGSCGRFASDAKRCPATPAVVPPVEPLLVRSAVDDVRCRQWVDSVLGTLSLKERIGQLFIYTIAPYQDKGNKELLRKVVEDYKVGGLLFSGDRCKTRPC